MLFPPKSHRRPAENVLITAILLALHRAYGADSPSDAPGEPTSCENYQTRFFLHRSRDGEKKRRLLCLFVCSRSPHSAIPKHAFNRLVLKIPGLELAFIPRPASQAPHHISRDFFHFSPAISQLFSPEFFDTGQERGAENKEEKKNHQFFSLLTRKKAKVFSFFALFTFSALPRHLRLAFFVLLMAHFFAYN